LTPSHNFHQTPGPAEGLPSCLSNGRVAPELNNDSFELWIALTKYASEQEPEGEVVQDAAIIQPPREIKPPLPKLAAGPWRSLGGYFDYSSWSDRDRFLELDRAIAAGQDLRDADASHEIEMV
jgi:hypothetical protein